MIFRPVPDRTAAERHVIDQLSRGGVLAQHVRDAIVWSRGLLLMAVPEHADVSALDYRWGRNWSTIEAQLALTEEISRFLDQAQNYVLLQHAQARVSDPWLREFPYRHLILICGTEVYFLLSGQRLGKDDLATLVKHSGYYPFSAFFCEGTSPKFGSPLDQAAIERIVAGTVGVAVGACDEETFLLWWHRDTSDQNR